MSLHAPHPWSSPAPCVFWALSAVTGRSWVELAQQYEPETLTDPRKIGVSSTRIWEILRAEGFKLEQIHTGSRMTLNSYLRRHSVRDPSVYWIEVTRHCLALCGDQIVGASFGIGPINRLIFHKSSRLQDVYRLLR